MKGSFELHVFIVTMRRDFKVAIVRSPLRTPSVATNPVGNRFVGERTGLHVGGDTPTDDDDRDGSDERRGRREFGVRMMRDDTIEIDAVFTEMTRQEIGVDQHTGYDGSLSDDRLFDGVNVRQPAHIVDGGLNFRETRATRGRGRRRRQLTQKLRGITFGRVTLHARCVVERGFAVNDASILQSRDDGDGEIVDTRSLMTGDGKRHVMTPIEFDGKDILMSSSSGSGGNVLAELQIGFVETENGTIIFATVVVVAAMLPHDFIDGRVFDGLRCRMSGMQRNFFRHDGMRLSGR